MPPLRPNSSGGFPSADTAVSRKIFSPKTVGLEWVYQTEPLAERMEVTGNPVVVLYASTSAAGTDFFARLIDVAPDGRSVDVAMGLIRAKYRNGRTMPPSPIKPDEIVRYEIRLRPTSNAFLRLHPPPGRVGNSA